MRHLNKSKIDRLNKYFSIEKFRGLILILHNIYYDNNFILLDTEFLPN